jgi:hypothetical protein
LAHERSPANLLEGPVELFEGCLDRADGPAAVDPGELPVKDHAGGKDAVDHGSVAIVGGLGPVVTAHEGIPLSTASDCSSSENAPTSPPARVETSHPKLRFPDATDRRHAATGGR